MSIGLTAAAIFSQYSLAHHLFGLSLFLPNVANVGKVVCKCFDLDLCSCPTIFSLLTSGPYKFHVVYQSINVFKLLHMFEQWPTTPRSCSVLSSTAIAEEPQAPSLLAEPSHWSTQFYKLASDWSAVLAIRLHHIILGQTNLHMQLLHQSANLNCTSCTISVHRGAESQH